MVPTSGPPRPPRPAEQPPPPSSNPETPEDPAVAAADAPMARFEFSDAGTKVLMVEWSPVAAGEAAAVDADASAGSAEAASEPLAPNPNPDSAPAAESAPPPPPPPPRVHTGEESSRLPRRRGPAPNWEVSWPGKTTVLRASESEADAGDSSDAPRDDGLHRRRRRVFFLLPQGASVPATVTLNPPPGDPRPAVALKPLPAIFPPGFDAEAGARGVLHTIWARRRLAALDREMADEMRTNAESVGLEMALAEKQWIRQHFLKTSQPQPQPQPHFASSARSNVSGRLGDKLRGLKLATSPADLVPGTLANTFTTGGQSNTLSPQGNDIAFSSFSAINSTAPVGPISLNAALHGDFAAAASAPVRMGSQDNDDELFALPLSPRSPDMKRSPFSAL